MYTYNKIKTIPFVHTYYNTPYTYVGEKKNKIKKYKKFKFYY